MSQRFFGTKDKAQWIACLILLGMGTNSCITKTQNEIPAETADASADRPESSPTTISALLATETWIKIGSQNTVLKLNPQDSSALKEGSEKYTLSKDSIWRLSARPVFQASENHFRVRFTSLPNKCSMPLDTDLFLFSPQVHSTRFKEQDSIFAYFTTSKDFKKLHFKMTANQGDGKLPWAL